VLERFSDVRGIRIEDDLVVTESGAEVLTHAIPKAPADIETRVGC
jgi:Xaa-Pro aminopeptidase